MQITTREVIALRRVHLVRQVFDAMRARAHICLELGLKAEQGWFKDGMYILNTIKSYESF